ncbi:hypothetical protein H5P28_06365 [Ruficoccus amylovorans]|uniref:Verru_Chthon cassette protein A n=1 Tax=Ruficoccus amylovorans TaxID=1804625 RepID=A0A842HEZ1_9BACT|nr:hypothetical protein [Ruficoccus amylovorans]MBC2593881.1 hypothetical protein [Ruficoccus amylovorans]
MKTISSPPAPRTSASGFALVMAMVLMGFLLLLTVSLSSLVNMELHATTQKREMQQARANALLGLSVAVGQLQKYAGPDQRVTAAASILETSDTNVGVTHPHWVGIWASADEDFVPQTLEHYTASGQKDSSGIEQAALTWLVSGNHDGTVTYSPHSATGTDEVTLMGEGSATDINDYVTAPLVSVPGESGLSVNRYAYWISDEGLKGNLAFNGEPASTLTAAEYQNYPLKSGSAVLKSGNTTTGDALFADLAPYADRLADLGQLDFVSTDSNVSKTLPHDATVWSYGVLSNVKNGGLRKDLADYTQLPDGPIFTDGPDWRHVKAFLGLANEVTTATDGSATIGHSPYYPNEGNEDKYHPGMYPIPVRLGTYMDAAFIDNGDGTYGIRMYFYPVIALWNPYDIALAPAQYKFAQWSGYDNSNLEFAVGRWDGTDHWEHMPMLIRKEDGSIAPESNPKSYVISNTRLTSSSASQFRMYYMVDESTGLQPGEVKVYTAPGLSSFSNNTQANILEEGFRPGAGFYLDMSPPSGSDYLSPYRFEVTSSDPIDTWLVDLGLKYTSGLGGDFLNEWWYMSTDATKTLITITGLNRAGLAYSFPSNTSNWAIEDDGRPRAFRPTVRTASDTDLMPNGSILGEYAIDQVDDFPAYAFIYELKQAFNDQNTDDQNRRRRWLANYNPRAPKLQQYLALADDIRTVNQSYIGQMRGRGYDINDSQSDLYYSPTVFGAGNKRMRFGYSYTDGGERTILFHIPRPNTPVPGVGILMHMNIAGFYGHNTGKFTPTNITPAYAIGNSYADPRLPKGELERTDAVSSNSFTHHDYSYKLNDALWDRFFSSTDLFGGNGPHDPRFISYPNADTIPAYTASERPYDNAAAKLIQQGTFNINSTSEKAWQMLLGSTFGTSVQTDDGDVELIPDRAQYLRSGLAFGSVFDGSDETDADAYEGFRGLTDEEIILLSREIVKEVKHRGPFTSLAQFVNRSSDDNAPDAHQLMGALQAAIDASTINEGFQQSVSAADASAQDPISTYPNADALYGSVGANTPGYLSQADLLSKVGNMLNARSDTFIIRVCGETRGLNGQSVTARAYCEAVVQRVPDYLYPDEDEATAFPPTYEDNKSFGRRFVIRSFRWLSQDDV